MNQQISVERKHLCFKHPFTCMTAGPTSSGKTVLIRQILGNYENCIYFKNEMPNQLKVIWAYGQWQELYNEKIDKNDITYIEGMPSEDDVKEISPHLIIIDDLMTELGNDRKL